MGLMLSTVPTDMMNKEQKSAYFIFGRCTKENNNRREGINKHELTIFESHGENGISWLKILDKHDWMGRP